jgi:hypothetical protein
MRFCLEDTSVTAGFSLRFITHPKESGFSMKLPGAITARPITTYRLLSVSRPSRIARRSM